MNPVISQKDQKDTFWKRDDIILQQESTLWKAVSSESEWNVSNSWIMPIWRDAHGESAWNSNRIRRATQSRQGNAGVSPGGADLLWLKGTYRQMTNQALLANLFLFMRWGREDSCGGWVIHIGGKSFSGAGGGLWAGADFHAGMIYGPGIPPLLLTQRLIAWPTAGSRFLFN